MSSYEDKLEAKRQRYAERARRKRAEARSSANGARQIMDLIPLGQPILVGHHSERRHRRDLARIDRGMQRAVEADRAAAHYEHKARTYGTLSISSDDPEAVAKLREQLGRLEAAREAAKPINAAIRRAVKAAQKRGEQPDHFAIIEALDASASVKADLRSYARAFPWTPQLDLKNLGANIRRIAARIAELERAAARPESEDIVGDGFRIEECKTDNRVRFYFDERPDRETCQKMKRSGFRWARSVGAWQRQLNATSVRIARALATELFGWQP